MIYYNIDFHILNQIHISGIKLILSCRVMIWVHLYLVFKCFDEIFLLMFIRNAGLYFSLFFSIYLILIVE